MKVMTGMAGLLAFMTISGTSPGQGCSDAGFCTINSFKPKDGDAGMADSKTPKNQFKMGVSTGSADYNISILAGFAEYHRQFTGKLSADVKLTWLRQSGSGTRESGLGDVFVTGNYQLKANSTITLGVKLPLHNGNRRNGNQPLPLDFQSSLGTTDLVLGYSRTIKQWIFAAALQQPLTQNSNRFLAETLPLNSPLKVFQSTNGFNRKGDVLLRVSRRFGAGKHWQFSPGLLPIYHLGEDSYRDAAGKTINIAGSQGLTLNATLFAGYRLSANSNLELSAGVPLVVRDTRPDGLTRSYVVGLEYKFRF